MHVTVKFVENSHTYINKSEVTERNVLRVSNL